MYVRTSDGETGILKAQYWFENKRLAEELTPQVGQLKLGFKNSGPEDKDLVDVRQHKR